MEKGLALKARIDKHAYSENLETDLLRGLNDMSGHVNH